MLKKILSSSLIKNAGIYGGTTVINAAIPFLMMPILTRYMSPSDYGLVSMFSVLLSFVSPIIGVSTHGAIARQYFNKEAIDLPSYITNCLILLIISFLVATFIFFFFSKIISDLSQFPIGWLWTVILVALSNFVITVVTTLWQVQSKPISYGKFQIAQTIVNVILSLWFVVGVGLTWKGRIQAQVITAAIFGILGLVILFRGKWLKPGINKAYIGNALKFGLPLIPHTVGAVVMTMSDRLFITNMVGLNATGLYSVGYAFGSIIGFMENSFNLAYSPWLFGKLNLNDSVVKIKIVKITYLYFIIILLGALSLSLIGPWFIGFFVGKKFEGAQIFVFWIALGFAFSGMYKMVVNYLFYIEKTSVLAWITFSSAILNLPLNYFLINLYGAVGAAMATTIVSGLFFVFTWILSNRYYKMPWLLKTDTLSENQTNKYD